MARIIVVVLLGATYAPAENLLSIGGSEGVPGTPEVSASLLATHDEPLHAFSAALRYEREQFTFLRVELDGTDIITGAVGYEYSHVVHREVEGEIILAVLLDIDPPYDHQEIPPSPTEPQLLAQLVFSIGYDSTPGDYLVQLRNGIGSPPVENVFSVFGRSVLPELQGGLLRILNPHHLRVRNTEGAAGATTSVVIEAEHTEAIAGCQIALRYPSDLLTIDTEPLDDPFDENPDEFVEPDICKWPVTWCNLGLETHLPDGVESFSPWAIPDYTYRQTTPGTGSGWLLVNTMFELDPPFRTLPAGTQAILRIAFKVAPTVNVGDEIPLTLVNGEGIPETSNMFVIPIPDQLPISARPELHAGAIRIVPGFRRGLINGDAKADIADVIYLLQYQFARGSPPPCMKGADTNDDGKVDIADAIYLLGYFFQHKAPPREPWTECNADPTPDALSCATPLGC